MYREQIENGIAAVVLNWRRYYLPRSETFLITLELCLNSMMVIDFWRRYGSWSGLI